MTDIERYRLRRAERRSRKCEINLDSVDAFKARRDMRLNKRCDAGVSWVYGILKDNGIDTEGMEPKQAFEELAKLNGGNKNNGGKETPSNGKIKKEPEKSSGNVKKDTNQKSKSKNHEYDGSNYHGEPGDVKTGKNGTFTPKHESAKRIDVKDAIGETNLYKESGGKKGIPKNSLTDFIDENGNLTPERQKVHDELVQQFFKDKVSFDGKPTMIMSGGGPASGKSFIEKGARGQFGDDTTITVDPDKIKEMLPGYTDMAIKSDEAAGYYHEESSALAKRIYQYAVDNGLNVVYDGTGDGSVNSVKKKIQTARDAGYAVNGEYVTVDVDGPDGALARNLKRYESGKKKFESGESSVPPRLPKENHVRAIHAAVSDIVPEVANLYDSFTLWDNNVPQGQPRIKIATCKRDGAIIAEKGQEDKVNKFFAKGHAGYSYSAGKVHKKV